MNANSLHVSRITFDDFDVATGVNGVVSSFCEFVYVYYVIPKGALQKAEGPRRLLPFCEGEHLKWV